MTLESRLLDQLSSSLQLLHEPVDRLVLAFSGGLDSCVLLHLLSLYPTKFKVLTWHVNHGLLENACEMENFCQSVASQYNFEFMVSRLHLNSKEGNLEARARKARYAVFEESLNQADCVLTAHHADDQVETFLLNSLRASGSAGLRGIADYKNLGNYQLIRPLLSVSRGDLERYAGEAGLQWFEDPSNQSDRFDRNYLRNQVIPLIKQRWPKYCDSIRTVCDIQAETQQLLDELALSDYQQCSKMTDAGKINLVQTRLVLLSNARQKNLVRFWLKDQGYDNLPRKKLAELIRQIGVSGESSAVIHSSDFDIRCYQKQLYLVPHFDPLRLSPAYDLDKSELLIIKELNLRISRDQVFKRFELQDNNQSVSIRFRPQDQSADGSRHRLKRLFQKYQIPPWRRPQIPQVYIDDQLVGLWLEK